MTVQLVSKERSVREQVSAQEWQARVELAAGHRVLAHYGVNDLTYNHFALRVPDEPQHMLVKRTDWMFGEVTASSLVKTDLDGNVIIPADSPPIRGGALIIHAGLLKARPDLNATLHTHTVAGMGVAAHKFGLLPINQHAMRFYGEMKYHDFKGFEFEPGMTPHLLQDLDGGAFMMLRNHGVLICGGSAPECVVNHHWLDMACKGQVAALAAGDGNYTVLDKADCEFAHDQFKKAGGFFKGGKDWAACLRLADRLDPAYKD
ncbi:MAG: Decarboxylase NovR [Alphaproteobacteria bacterium MarineAlpha10_Bin3]|jgi:ribulose-5-phosphate 4-epimerase/fuculose-1-phosphate aldolase|nr:MAG: Decarboxylase NovR [Alphaproteobacteria bacterium MarineAlpha10_Bin3]PPR72509.1 MAG: Decarboxylase NovR [Alphaproteobacteria bacterium MarineAlpha4_Bin1]